MKFVNQDFRARIEALVREAEAKTSVEFVPVVVARSSSLATARGAASLFVFSVLMFLSRIFEPGSTAWMVEALAAMVVSGVCFALLGTSFGLRVLLPKPWTLRAVEDGARRQFLQTEVFATRCRTGVLIYVSLAERAVYVMPDKGVAAKLPADEWAALGARLAADFDQARPGDTFVEALRTLVERLAPEFPPDPNDPNELPDQLIAPS